MVRGKRYVWLGVGGVLLLFWLATLSSVGWSPAALFFTPDQRGKMLMAKGDFKGAASHFQDPSWRGTALYRNGDFKEAAAAFGRGVDADSLYNRSNGLLMAGQYDAAISGYEQALSLQPGWLEALENLALARARKERLRGPDDDFGGTGGQLGADKIVFDDRAAQSSAEAEEISYGEAPADQEMRALWLRRVKTDPADFLRSKFAYQLMRQQQKGETK